MNAYLVNTLYSLAHDLPLDFPWRETLQESGLDLRSVEAGQTLMTQDDRAHQVLFLIEGQVEVVNFSLGGDRSISAYLEGPQFLGLVEYLAGREGVLSEVKTLTEASLVFLSLSEVEDLLADPSFYRYFLTYLAKLSMGTMAKHSEERAMDPKTLLLDYLYQVAARSDFPVEVLDKKQDMADLLNIQIRTLYRYLKDLEDQGLIVRKRQAIYITKKQFGRIKRALGKK